MSKSSHKQPLSKAPKKPGQHFGSISYALVGLGELLRNFYISVPRYQRDYAWESINVVDLLDDISLALSKNETQYFLGSIVLTQISPDELEVVDGQQRLATTFTLLCAIRDYFHSHGEIERAKAIHSQYIEVADLKAGEPRARMTLNATDNPHFQSLFVEGFTDKSNLAKAGTASHGRLDEAYRICMQQVSSIAEGHGDHWRDELASLVSYVDKGASAIRVIVPDHATAFTIFETLNDRGLPLAVSDLLKNFLFASAKSRISEAEAAWLKMTAVLEAIQDRDVPAEFIRHFWSSYRGLTRTREIFKDAKQQVISAKSAVKLCVNMERNAKHYAAFVNSSSPYWDPFGNEAKSLIDGLNAMRMVQVRPLLLAVFDQFKKNDAISSLRLLVSASVRILVSASRGGTVEKMYAELAKKVRDGLIKNATQLHAALTRHVPNNVEFEAEFRNARVSKDYLARYYLRSLEHYSNPKMPEWNVSSSTADVNLEHVLPKKLTADWSHFDEETHGSLVSRLGNMCLILEAENAAIGNASFAKKRVVYDKSSITLTKELATAKSWTAAEIEKRATRLAKLAIKTWPLTVAIGRPAVAKERLKKAPR